MGYVLGWGREGNVTGEGRERPSARDTGNGGEGGITASAAGRPSGRLRVAAAFRCRVAPPVEPAFWILGFESRNAGAGRHSASAKSLKLEMAEREGFEPSRGFHPCRFSRPVQSTTLPPLRGWALSGKEGGLATEGGPRGLAATRGRDRFGPAVLTLRALPGGNVLRRLRRLVEPSRGFHPCRFSRPVQSTTLPPLRGWALSGKGDGLATGGGARSPGEGGDGSAIFGMQRLTFARLNPNLVRASGG